MFQWQNSQTWTTPEVLQSSGYTLGLNTSETPLHHALLTRSLQTIHQPIRSIPNFQVIWNGRERSLLYSIFEYSIECHDIGLTGIVRGGIQSAMGGGSFLVNEKINLLTWKWVGLAFT